MSLQSDIVEVTENKLTLKQQRAEHVNQVIRIIADHGRRFFYSQPPAEAV